VVLAHSEPNAKRQPGGGQAKRRGRRRSSNPLLGCGLSQAPGAHSTGSRPFPSSPEPTDASPMSWCDQKRNNQARRRCFSRGIPGNRQIVPEQPRGEALGLRQCSGAFGQRPRLIGRRQARPRSKTQPRQPKAGSRDATVTPRCHPGTAGWGGDCGRSREPTLSSKTGQSTDSQSGGQPVSGLKDRGTQATGVRLHSRNSVKNHALLILRVAGTEPDHASAEDRTLSTVRSLANGRSGRSSGPACPCQSQCKAINPRSTIFAAHPLDPTRQKVSAFDRTQNSALECYMTTDATLIAQLPGRTGAADS
jgi:hypothetical protein